jgi:hypothetical protein
MVICQSPIHQTTETANNLGDTLGAFRSSVSNAAAYFPGQAFYLEGTNIVTGAGMSVDGIHPIDLGFAQWTKVAIQTLSTNK